jgi:hypothetical protein
MFTFIEASETKERGQLKNIKRNRDGKATYVMKKIVPITQATIANDPYSQVKFFSALAAVNAKLIAAESACWN